MIDPVQETLKARQGRRMSALLREAKHAGDGVADVGKYEVDPEQEAQEAAREAGEALGRAMRAYHDRMVALGSGVVAGYGPEPERRPEPWSVTVRLWLALVIGMAIGAVITLTYVRVP